MPRHIVSMQVGASNELPESEELDALYDRFLVSAHHFNDVKTHI
jgi:MoxR domain in the MoxR-vWA-beta-propeller ternary systems